MKRDVGRGQCVQESFSNPGALGHQAYLELCLKNEAKILMLTSLQSVQ